jgi:hypothetical protein
VRGKAKKVGRVSPLRAARQTTKNGAHGVTRPTAFLEDATPYRVGQRVPPVSDQAAQFADSEKLETGATPVLRFIDLFCGIGGFVPSPIGWERVAAGG